MLELVVDRVRLAQIELDIASRFGCLRCNAPFLIGSVRYAGANIRYKSDDRTALSLREAKASRLTFPSWSLVTSTTAQLKANYVYHLV